VQAARGSGLEPWGTMPQLQLHWQLPQHSSQLQLRQLLLGYAQANVPSPHRDGQRYHIEEQHCHDPAVRPLRILLAHEQERRPEWQQEAPRRLPAALAGSGGPVRLAFGQHPSEASLSHIELPRDNSRGRSQAQHTRPVLSETPKPRG